ncbi:MAG: transcription factor S [Nanoarchaeota archaeon]
MFCKKCGSILVPKKVGTKTIFSCSCGYKLENKESSVIREQISNTSNKVEIVDMDESLKILPKMKVECPKCGNLEAYFWEIQTRASDEPATKFIKCVKCKHTWRDYN